MQAPRKPTQERCSLLLLLSTALSLSLLGSGCAASQDTVSQPHTTVRAQVQPPVTVSTQSTQATAPATGKTSRRHTHGERALRSRPSARRRKSSTTPSHSTHSVATTAPAATPSVHSALTRLAKGCGRTRTSGSHRSRTRAHNLSLICGSRLHGAPITTRHPSRGPGKPVPLKVLGPTVHGSG